MSFLKSLVKNSGNPYANIVNDGVEADVLAWIDTGSMAFNALVSGSLHGGMADNKIIGIAGESATGKTYFTIGIVAKFLLDNPDSVVVYFDSEQAVTSDMIEARGIDPSRIAVFPVATVEDLRCQALKIIAAYEEEKPDKNGNKRRMMMVVDSLGMLSTIKEITDSTEGKNVRDMTRAQVIKGAFRTLSIKLGHNKIPMIVTNHTYDVVGCLDSSASVIMGDDTVKNITEISVGDCVKTLGGTSIVTDLFSYEVPEIVQIELEDGTIVKATPNHKFMTREGEWKPISDFVEGEEIVSFEHTTKA